MSETHARLDQVGCASSNVSLFAALAAILLPENDIGNSDMHKPDDIDKANDLVIKEHSMTKLQLESSKVLEDAGAVKSDK